ncbi:MAG: anti-sigma factor [Ornithinimicrobium sp.]
MHIDSDDLALVALGGGEQQHRDHLSGCAQCRAEVDSLAAVTHIMSLGGPVPVQAPAHLWPAIEAAIQETAADGGARSSTPTSDRSTSLTSPALPEESQSLDSRRKHRQSASHASRRFSGVALLGAAAAGAALMWIGSTIVGQDGPVEGPVLATADLAALESTVTPGSAQVFEEDGRRVLRIEASALPPVTDGYLQVWLLADDATGMVALGSLTEGGEEFELPPGLSMDTFTTVDVSVEHYDGNPAHSGESLWRGPLSRT